MRKYNNIINNIIYTIINIQLIFTDNNYYTVLLQFQNAIIKIYENTNNFIDKRKFHENLTKKIMSDKWLHFYKMKC